MLLQHVCLSVLRRYYVETAKRTIKLFFTTGSHIILVYPHQILRQYADRDPLTVVLNVGEI